MQLRFLALILLVAVMAPPVCAQQVPKPLTKDQVMEFVKVGMEPARLVKLIQEHGIGFDPSDDDLQALRKAGAPDPVIQAVRNARPKPLTRDQVLGLVAQGVPPARAAMLVKQRGITFLADDAYLENLRLAGGTDELVAAVREAKLGATLPIRQLNAHSGTVGTIAFSPDGNLLASGSFDRTVKLWDVATGTLQQTLSGPHEAMYSAGVLSIAFSPDGKLLASGAQFEPTTLWDVAAGVLEQSLSKDCFDAWAIAFSPDGKFLACGLQFKPIALWDVATGVVKKSFPQNPPETGGAAYSPDGKLLPGYIAHTKLAFSPDGNLLASATWENDTVKVWDVATGAVQQTLSAGYVNSLAFSPDGKLLAAGGGYGGAVKSWEVASGTLRQTYPGPGGGGSVNTIAFSPDGKLLACGYNSHEIRLLDVATGELTELLSLPDAAGSVAFSPDGKLLACGIADGTVTIWRLKQY